jgi:glycosyltransferase involved in cell wall biosynthesis
LIIIKNYPLALQKGKRASERILSKFTWDISAKRLAEIIGRYKCQSLRKAM